MSGTGLRGGHLTAGTAPNENEPMENLIFRSLVRFSGELERLASLPEQRYNRKTFPTVGQYDWLAGQVLYALIRQTRPRTIVEFSTSSGYSTTFSALALQANGAGRIHTVDIDLRAQEAARRWISACGLVDQVVFHHGDCRRIVPGLVGRGIDLLFVDSLHSFDMAEWYLTRVVPRLEGDALVHIHDVMPLEARVRIHGGPPFQSARSAARSNILQRAKSIVWLLAHGKAGSLWPASPARELLPLHKLQCFQPASSGELPTIDGNYFEEAVLIREVVREGSPRDFVYLHRLLPYLAQYEPQRFAHQDEIQRTDSRAAALEWNDCLWCRAQKLQELVAHKRIRAIRRALEHQFDPSA